MATYFEREFKRKNGTTYKRWCGEEKINGKSKTVYGKTKKECKAKLEAITVENSVFGGELEKTTLTVSELFYKHLFLNLHNNIAHSTFDRYMNLYNSHIKDCSFGKMKISKVKQEDVAEYFKNKKNTPTKVLSMLRYLLRQSFNLAIKNNWIRANPVESIKLPKIESKRKSVDIFTIEEQEKFISVLHTTKYSLFFKTAMMTGMRLGELVALKWQNVDLVSGAIRVCESYRRTTKYDDEGNSERIIDKKSPKTENSNRDIPINDMLLQLLKDHKKTNDSEYVFCTSIGSHMTPENVRRIQIALCKKAGIPYKNFHSLRHTFATRLIENGVDVKTVSKLLGHSDIYITLNTYVHDTSDSKSKAVNTLEKFLL